MMAFTMDFVFRRMNPLWWIWFVLYSMIAWTWQAFKWFFLMDWWQPTTLIGKVLKWPIVAWVNVPLSLPLTFAYLAVVAGMDPTVLPFVTPEIGEAVTAFVNK